MGRFWEYYKGVIVVVVAVIVVACTVWFIMMKLGPCHEGHHETHYQASHTTYTKIGDVNVPHFHPARCYTIFVCDVRCNELGKVEHPEHTTIDHGLTWVDGRCE